MLNANDTAMILIKSEECTNKLYVVIKCNTIETKIVQKGCLPLQDIRALFMRLYIKRQNLCER